jgi:hypothetical protein
VLAVPHLCEFYPGICLATEEKARKNLGHSSRRVRSIHSTKTPTDYKTYTHARAPTYYKTHTYTTTHTYTHTHTHTLQNNWKPSEYKLKQTHTQDIPKWNSHNIINYCVYCCHWHNPSDRIMAMRSTRPLTEINTRKNKFQEYFLRCKFCRCVGLTTLPPSHADSFEIWEPQLPGTLKDWFFLEIFV